MSSMEIFDSIWQAPKLGYSCKMLPEYDHNTVASFSNEKLAGMAGLTWRAKQEMNHDP